MEACDANTSPQDWNHAWGAAPANLIPRKPTGTTPLEPGFRKIRIKPQPVTLKEAEIRHPTLRGEVSVSFVNDPGTSFSLTVDLPANTTAEVLLPYFQKRQRVLVNGTPVPFGRRGNFILVENIGSGRSQFEVVK